MPNFKQTYGSHWWVDVKYIPAFNPVQKQMWDLVFLQAESMHAVRWWAFISEIRLLFQKVYA